MPDRYSNLREAIKESVAEAYQDYRKELMQDMEENWIPQKDFDEYLIKYSNRAIKNLLERIMS